MGQVFGFVVGLMFIATGVAMSTASSMPAWVTWGGFFPMGLAAATIMPIALSAPVRAKLEVWLFEVGTVVTLQMGEPRELPAAPMKV